MDNYFPDDTILQAQEPASASKRRKGVIIAGILFIWLGAAYAYYYVYKKKEDPSYGDNVYMRKDGSVKQVEDYVKEKILANPASFTPIHWTKLQKTDVFGMVSYKIGLVYKGKNQKNEVVMDSKMFELDENGTVLFVMDTGPMHNP